MRDRASKTAAAMAAPGGTVAQPKKGGLIEALRNTPRFLNEVRAEARKITWTSRKETWITSVMVFIMVVMAAFFFFVVNWILNTAITWLLRLATAG
jgi:preprotein translocase subunit SecE